jgi:hypothetical protein
MTYFAKLDADNIVIFVTAGRVEDDGLEEELNARTGDVYRQTYLDGSARFNYAGLGHTYDADRDAFIPPTPYPSWVLDEATCLWVAPIDYPADGGQYVWDEETTEWVAMPETEEN